MLLLNIIFKRNCPSRSQSWTLKTKQNHVRGVKKTCFWFSIKNGSGEGSWVSFGEVFGCQREAKKPQDGSMLQKEAGENSNEN